MTLIAVIGLTGGDPRAEVGDSPVVAQPVIGLPVATLVPFGAAPDENGGTVWGYGTPQPGSDDAGSAIVLVRAGKDGVWSVAGAPQSRDGSPLKGFHPAAAVPNGDRALAAQVTAKGGGLLVGTDAGQDDAQVLLARDPGGPFRALPAPDKLDPDPPAPGPAPDPSADPSDPAAAPAPPTGAIALGESLYSARDSRLPAAPIDEGDHTGILIAPATQDDDPQTAVLHWDHEQWTREPIDAPAAATDLRVVALAAAGADNAWLLASSKAGDRPFMLFRRVDVGGSPRWELRTDPSAPLLGAGASLPAGVTIAAAEAGQPLTVTSDGVWVDGTAKAGGAGGDLTFFFTADGDAGHVVASWCDASTGGGPLCTHRMGRDRTDPEYRSSAWPGTGTGTRVVSGYGRGLVRRLEGDTFATILGTGGSSGWTGRSAAFLSPDEGWTGGSPIAHFTATPQADRVQPWPVPFRRPLLAVAIEPGHDAGDLGARALAVGDVGQVARYGPADGWRPEFLLGANGRRATPRLRGVAWPTASMAYAVGDNGEMWRWRRVTGLWESDPGKPPSFEAHLNGIAFDPANANRGYAVGKDGALLRYDKSWQRDAPPAGLEHAQFTSIAFAGSQALVSYRVTDSQDISKQHGGLIVNDGSGWRIDTDVAALLDAAGGGPLRRVAALPDGGAVAAAGGAAAAGRTVVLERDGAGRPWRFSPHPLAGVSEVSALAAVRDGGVVRAVLSVDPDNNNVFQNIDTPTSEPPPGAAPFQPGPDPLPATGMVLRETADGWRDEQHAGFALAAAGDAASRPDSVLAFALTPSGDAGWVVGGETGGIVRTPVSGASEAIQTAGVGRYPPAAVTPPGSATAPIAAGAGVTFAVGGNARCLSACAAIANAAPGPDAWLRSAIATASRTGARGLLYTGARLADDAARSAAAGDELARYGTLVRSGGTFPVFAAAAPSDADASGSTAAFGDAVAPFGAQPAPAGTALRFRTTSGSARTYYAFDSTGPEGAARVIVLDYSAPSLDPPQLCWLASSLGSARADGLPAIVVGSRPLAGGLGGIAADAAVVSALLAGGATPASCPGVAAGRASAYFFDSIGENRQVPITAGGGTLPSFGSGTLGYTGFHAATETSDFDAGGFLLATIDVVRRDPATNQAPVAIRLIPNIGELGVDATDGTLLRRSQLALFQALARRPRGGLGFEGNLAVPDPYVAIPARCLGADCASFVAPEYSFSSSNPDIADFVRSDPSSTDPRAVLLGPGDKPIADPTSGLLCAYNAGTTTVTLVTGGLSYSMKLTVQPGTVQRPCGTVPLKNPPARAAATEVPDLVEPNQPAEEPSSPSGAPATIAPPPAPATAPAKAAPPKPAPLAGLPVVPGPPLGVTQLTPALPTTPPVAQPTPPSGTAQVNVTQPVSQTAAAPQRQREEEEAIEMVHHMAAYDAQSRRTLPPYLPALVLLAALAGGGGYRALRRRDIPAYIDASSHPPSDPRSRS